MTRLNDHGPYEKESTTFLGVPPWVRFCRQEFGEFPRPAWAMGSYSSGPPAGGTPQILVDKMSPMTGHLRVYIFSHFASECYNTNTVGVQIRGTLISVSAYPGLRE